MRREPVRWWGYQKERFPLFVHGPLVAVFSFAALCFSSLLRQQMTFPPASSVTVAFLVALGFFLQLRIADEFKDAAEDARWRPYRPVPRGLVTLKELGTLWVGVAVLQLLLSLWLHPPLMLCLGVVWGYLWLMRREFFAETWLRRHPLVYMWSHMLIMPLIHLFTSACDWMPAQAGMPRGMGWFLAASFFNGMVIEVGRKMRAKEEEEQGVETYTALWGPRRAVQYWWGTLAAAAICAAAAGARIGFALTMVGAVTIMLMPALAVGHSFVRTGTTQRARYFEPLSGLWTIVLYLMLGVIPLWVRGG